MAAPRMCMCREPVRNDDVESPMVPMPVRRTVLVAAAVTLAGILCCRFATAQEPAPTPFGTTIEVRRIVTEVRVVASDGSPVLGLGPEDFRVKVGGDPAEVESVLWVPSTRNAVETGVTGPGRNLAAEDAERPPEGRLIVILFQIDFGLHSSRTVGLLRMAPRASEFVANLSPGDRVAVMVYDSHLELRADFTDDRLAIAEMLTPTEILQGRIAPPDPEGPSLAAHLDPEAMLEAASMADALELIGRGLREVPGASPWSSSATPSAR